MDVKKLLVSSMVVGFALFSMFFGAGNIIFPPYVGLSAGQDWLWGFLGYYMADVGLAMVAVFAMLRTESIGKVENIMWRLGRIPARTMMVIIIVCIGPLLAMPRTGAVTYSMVLAPIFGEDNLVASLIFSALFFGLTILFAFRESSLVDLVGRYLTPVLVCGLLLMIVMGAISPIGEISPIAKVDNVVSQGIILGYQTLDVMAIIVFGMLVVNSMKARGYSSPRMKFISVGLASLIAGFVLFVVYFGLCYLGATASELYGKEVEMGLLVMGISQRIFGSAGSFVLSLVIALACLTTAIALAGSMGIFFNTLTDGKLPYRTGTISSCVFSAFIANFGLDNIVKLAAPILTIAYPGVLAVIVLSLFNDKIKNDNVFKFAAAGAMLVSFCEVMGWYFPKAFAFIKVLPMQSLGLGWITPTAICAFIGFFVRSSTPRSVDATP